jgi:hypothetical protein
MALDETNRVRVTAQALREGVWPGISKVELRNAINATDDWIDTNQTSFNNALPVNVRNSLNLVQKTLLFCFVAMRRAGRLKAEED